MRGPPASTTEYHRQWFWGLAVATSATILALTVGVARAPAGAATFVTGPSSSVVPLSHFDRRFADVDHSARNHVVELVATGSLDQRKPIVIENDDPGTNPSLEHRVKAARDAADGKWRRTSPRS